MAPAYQISTTDVCLFLVAVVLIYKISTNRKSSITTKLRGPPRQSLLFGLIRVLRNAEDPGLLYEQWASEYGSVYSFPAFLGEQRLVLYDPKAVAHFYGKEGFGYIKTPISRMFIEILVCFSSRKYDQIFLMYFGSQFGKNLLWAEGELHRRRQALFHVVRLHADKKTYLQATQISHAGVQQRGYTRSYLCFLRLGSQGTNFAPTIGYLPKFHLDVICLGCYSRGKRWDFDDRCAELVCHSSAGNNTDLLISIS